ncbi:unnamed protein product, partial [Echinostoma caproni]|uniref:DUF7083 domain-containing protein n=1 Tax=Echinostoma caproni TaxID=27848 RepID=A0A183BCM3_9TREM
MEMFMQMLHTQNNLIEALAKKMEQSPSLKPINASLTSDNLANAITEFTYDADAELTFECWYARFGDIFTVDCALWEHTDKVRLLMRKLGPVEHQRYTNYILPSKPTDVQFSETVKCLTQIFSARASLFHTRYQCLQVKKTQSEDFVTCAGRINLEAERLKLKDLSMDQFKCLLFVSALQSATDAELRNRILSQIENSPDLILHNITEECQRVKNIKMDSALIAIGSDHNTVNRLQVSPNKRKAWKAPINPLSLLSSVIAGGFVRTKPTPALPQPSKFSIGDNFRRWAGGAQDYVPLFPPNERRIVLLSLLDGQAKD